MTPPDEVEAALADFRRWGAVVEHQLFRVSASPSVEMHFAAACSSLQACIEKWPALQERWAIQPDKMVVSSGRRIRPEAFFGPDVDIPRRRLFAGRGLTFAAGIEDDVELPECSGWLMPKSLNPFGAEDAGFYAHALLHPPHGLYELTKILEHREQARPIGIAFWRLCDALFGNLESLEIYSWPVTASDFFGPGLEWWGTMFSTVYCPEKNWIVATVASSTD